jgi:hypothetical protein
MSLFFVQHLDNFSLQGTAASIAAIHGMISGNANAFQQSQDPRSAKPRVVVVQRAGKGAGVGVGVAGVQRDVNAKLVGQKAQLAWASDIETLRLNCGTLLKLAISLSTYSDAAPRSQLQEICTGLGLELPGIPHTASDKVADAVDDWLARVMDKAGIPALSLAEAYVAIVDGMTFAKGEKGFGKKKGVAKMADDNDHLSPKDFQAAIDFIKNHPPPGRKKKWLIAVQTLTLDGVATTLIVKSGSGSGQLVSEVKKLKGNDFLTVLKVAQKLGAPRELARTMLDHVVATDGEPGVIGGRQRGLLSVDDSMAGVRYYRNRFGEFAERFLAPPRARK